MADLDLTSAHVRVIVPTVIATTVALPKMPNVAVLPVAGPAGPEGSTGPAGEGTDPDLPDLTLLFENALL